TCPFKYFVYQYERNYNAKDQDRNCHIQGFFHLKNQMRIGNYKLANGDQKEKKSGIKEKLQIDKIHFDLVASDKDSIIYCKKKHNKCSIHNRLIVKYEDYPHLSKEEFMKNTITNLKKIF
ncbi:25343_t:CDS:1, partial [Dentiscutata erythropus]